MIRRKMFVIVLGLSIMLLGCGLIYGSVSVSVTNHFETGVVDITLTEYQKVGDVETLWDNNPTVLPGDIISKIPRILNDGNDCYVRAKIAFRETDEIGEDNLFGITDQWVKADDGFWYYKEILPHGSKVDIFEGLAIPEDLSQANEEKKFYLDVTVDAIQSKNFTPDFAAAAPWGSVEILECEKEGQYNVDEFKPSDSKSFSVVYQGEVKELIANEKDFFANIPYLMPGDVYSDSVSIKNSGKQDMQLYFRSETEDVSELLDKITLKITTEIDGETQVFYEGSLRAETLTDDYVLGKVQAGTEGKFHFEISVPAELNNHYSLLDSNVTWIFSTEEIPPNPDTGDDTDVGVYQLLMGVCLVSFGLLLVLGAKKDKKEDKKGV